MLTNLRYFAVKIKLVTLLTHDKTVIRHLLISHFNLVVISIFFVNCVGNKDYHARTGIFQAGTNRLPLQTLYDYQIQINDPQ